MTGPLPQNSGISALTEFIVNGPVVIGHSGGISYVVKSLSFQPGSSLTIYNKLTVTQGPVNLMDGSSIHLNGTLSASQLNVLSARR